MSSKPCFVCLAVKPLDQFYRHAAMKDGRLNKCIECTKAAVILNRLAKIDHYRSYDRSVATCRTASRRARSTSRPKRFESPARQQRSDGQ